MKHFKFIALSVLLTTAGLKAQTDSIKSTEKERPFQLTFISPLGTNGVDCYKITNHVSLNVLIGVSRGVKGFEAGSIANIVLKDVKGAQFAGVANVVLGSIHGAQFASYFNYCGKDIKGATFAGAANIGLGELHGGQFVGAFNFNRRGGSGVQIAGHSNIMLGNFKGTQVASVANISTGDIEGAQISACVNVAKNVKGIQIGIINIADSVEGATIGLLNIVKKGKHQLEFSADELFYANLSYRTGTNAFYNIFTTGFKPGSKDNLWNIGYGAGTSFRLKDKFRGDISVTAQHVSGGGFYWGTSELMRLYCGVEYKIAKKFSIAAGPTFNIFMSDELLTKKETSRQVAPYHTLNYTTFDDFNLKGWVGGRIALRFL